jgi:pSer/pThr/pTyr-binding forkhead associated (FHA) protein
VVRCSRELFLEACGLSGPLQLHLGDRGGVESRTFEQPFVVVGRSPGADLVLDHAVVSRKHAFLQVIAGRVFCVDMRSRAGVVWERGPGRSGWVDGQRGVRIGPFRIRAGGDAGPVNLVDPLQRGVRIAAGSPEDSPLPTVTLEFPQELEQPPWRVSRMLTLVGRAPECPLRLEDRGVSKFHCSLLRMPAGVWLVDLLGRDGIDVNGQPVRWARLEHGDRVRVGPYLFRIRCEGPPASPHGPGTRALGVQSVVTSPSGWPATSPEVGDGSTCGAPMLSPAWSPPSAAA